MEPFGINGLLQEVVSAQLGGLHSFFNGALPRQHDEAQARARVMELAQQFHAGHLRHTKIGNDHGGVESRNLFQTFGAVTCRVGLIAPGVQQV